MSICMTPAGVKYLHSCLLQESSMSICMAHAGVKYGNLDDSCISQVSPCMTPAEVSYLHA